MSPYVIIFVQLLTLAFAGGGAWVALKQGQKDVNGLGRKMGEVVRRANLRYHKLTSALLVVCSEEQKIEIAKLLDEEQGS